MTVWTVQRDERGWSVVGPEGTRRSLTGLSCIQAQVIVAELEGAYAKGREDQRNELASETLGD